MAGLLWISTRLTFIYFALFSFMNYHNTLIYYLIGNKFPVYCWLDKKWNIFAKRPTTYNAKLPTYSMLYFSRFLDYLSFQEKLVKWKKHTFRFNTAVRIWWVFSNRSRISYGIKIKQNYHCELSRSDDKTIYSLND